MEMAATWSQAARRGAGVMALRMMRPALRTGDLSIAKLPPKVADAHYATPEHRAWRTAVIARASGVCEWHQAVQSDRDRALQAHGVTATARAERYAR